MQIVAALAIPLFAVSALLAAEDQRVAMTGILGALDEEVQMIRQEMSNSKEVRMLGRRFLVGTLRGRPVVLAQTGVGKVNAATITALVLERFRPREVIFTGIAGGLNPTLRPGDIVVGTKLVQHDLGSYTPEGFVPRTWANPVDGKTNPLFFASEPYLIAMVERASRLVSLDSFDDNGVVRKPTIVKGIIATGDAFIASEAKKHDIRKQSQADAVEMEGAAVAQVCYQAGVPLVVIRSLSDSADNHATHDVQRFVGIAAQNSASLVMKTVELLAEQKVDVQSPPAESKTTTQSNTAR
jgi:adenosylhomocysteine nucleosidase